MKTAPRSQSADGFSHRFDPQARIAHGKGYHVKRAMIMLAQWKVHDRLIRFVKAVISARRYDAHDRSLGGTITDETNLSDWIFSWPQFVGHCFVDHRDRQRILPV